MLKSLVLSVALAMAPAAQEAVQQDTAVTVISLEKALQIALSENVSVKVADQEIQRAEYARKGSYAALFPSIDGSAAYQRTIKKQVMYMDGDGFNLGAMLGDTFAQYLGPLYAQHPGIPFPSPSTDDPASEQGGNDGFSVGRWNTWSAGVSAALPLVNAQLWKSIAISGEDVELAVEKARSSRLETVTAVKQAYFSVLLAKQAYAVYKSVFENALANCELTERKYKAQKASELDLTRAKTALANAIPNMYDSENSINLTLWQLKAVMGIDLDSNIDVEGELSDYAKSMFYDIHSNDDPDLSSNSSLRQLEIQAAELENMVTLQKYACLPSLSLGFSYSINAMTNDFKFSEYQWSPYSYVGLSLNIPIFAGGKRLNQVRQAKVQASELSLQKANAERQVRIGIRQSLNSMETAMKSHTAAEEALGTARKAYDIAQKSYNVGRSTLTDLNDAQLALTQAQLSVAQTVYSFVTAKAQLEQLLGKDFTTQEK